MNFQPVKKKNTNLFIPKKTDKDFQILIKTRFEYLIKMLQQQFADIDSFIDSYIEENVMDFAETEGVKRLNHHSQKTLFLLYILSKEVELNDELIKKHYKRYRGFTNNLHKRSKSF